MHRKIQVVAVSAGNPIKTEEPVFFFPPLGFSTYASLFFVHLLYLWHCFSHLCLLSIFGLWSIFLRPTSSFSLVESAWSVRLMTLNWELLCTCLIIKCGSGTKEKKKSHTTLCLDKLLHHIEKMQLVFWQQVQVNILLAMVVKNIFSHNWQKDNLNNSI